MEKIDDPLLRITAISHCLRNSKTCSCSPVPVRLFYEVITDEIQVIAVFPSRRDPQKWKSRVE
jgi:hypothetical protein